MLTGIIKSMGKMENMKFQVNKKCFFKKMAGFFENLLKKLLGF